MASPFTPETISVRQNLWLFSQGEGEDFLILGRREGKLLWRSILDSQARAHRELEAWKLRCKAAESALDRIIGEAAKYDLERGAE